jgi:hypothetical protein
VELQEAGKIVAQPGSGSRLAASLATYKLANDILQPRLRGPVAPPVVIGSPDNIGNPVVWLIGDDVVGFMHGTILQSPPGEILVLCQDGQERTFNTEHKLFPDDIPQAGSLDARIILNIADPGINYFRGDAVFVNIHSQNRQTAVVLEVLPTPPDTARVRLDTTGDETLMPFSHMVLRGAGLGIPKFDSVYNAR